MEVIKSPFTFLPLAKFFPRIVEEIKQQLDPDLAELIQEIGSIEFPQPSVRTDLDPGLADVSFSFLDTVGLTEHFIQFVDGAFVCHGVLGVLPGFEPRCPVPGFSQLNIVVQSLGTIRFEASLERIFLEIKGPTLALRFDPAWFRPARPADAEPGENTAETDLPTFAEIAIVDLGYFSIDSDKNIRFGVSENGNLSFVTNNDPWLIGETGVSLETGSLTLSLDRAQGGPFILLSSAKIRLPAGIEAKEGSPRFSFSLINARIDPNGFSGHIVGSFDDTEVVLEEEKPVRFTGLGAASFAGFELGLKKIEIDFQNNVPIHSSLVAEMIVPFFDDYVGCELKIGARGEFSIALTDLDEDGLIHFEKEDLLAFTVTQFEIDHSSESTALILGGEIEVLATAELEGDFTFEVERLKIDSRGGVSLKGAWITLNPSKEFDLVGFILSVNQLGFGFDESSLWVGMSGGITLIDSLPSAVVKKLKLNLPFNGEAPTVTLEGAELKAKVGVFNMEGGFQLLEGQRSSGGYPMSGFGGDVTLSMTAPPFVFEGSLLVGKVHGPDPYSFFYVAISLELPSGIPLIVPPPTGIAIFGFKGLFGYNVAPNRTPEQHWYYDWYMGPPGPGVTQSTKWGPKQNQFAFGAGLIIGTQDRFTVMADAILVITLPSFSILISGRGGIFTNPDTGLTTLEMRTLIVLSANEGVYFALEARFEPVPNILFAHGMVDAFFPADLKGWYVHVGVDQPTSKRIAAEVIKRLFRADAYVMMDARAIRFGAFIGYGFEKKFGPCRVLIENGLRGEGYLTYEPIQYFAQLERYGRISLEAFGYGISLSISGLIVVRVPTPFLLSLSFDAKLGLPWPLPDIHYHYELKWEDAVKPRYPDLLSAVSARYRLNTTTHVLQPSSSTSGIPIDSIVALTFSHAISKPTLEAMDAFPHLLNFRPTLLHKVSSEYKFKYTLQSLELELLDSAGNVEKTYDFKNREEGLFGSWQLAEIEDLGQPPRLESDRASGASLMLMAKTPYPYLVGSSTPMAGDAVPCALPSYELLAVNPPLSWTLATPNLFNTNTELRPSAGETALGEPDPTLPSNVTAPNGVEVEVPGFVEHQGEGFVDPLGGPTEARIHFPKPVVLTGKPDDNDIRYWLNDTPVAPGPIEETPVVKPKPRFPELPKCLKCLLVGLVLTLLVLLFAMLYAAGRVPWLPTAPRTTVLVLILGALLIAFIWWLICKFCPCDPLSDHDNTKKSPQTPQPAPSSKTPRSFDRSLFPAVPVGLVADRIDIPLSRSVTFDYVFADARDDYANTLDTNSYRSDLSHLAARISSENLRAPTFLFKASRQYRVKAGLLKTGLGEQRIPENKEFLFTTAGTPSDLSEYVLMTYPMTNQETVFRNEEVGVRFLETYIRQMYEDCAQTQLLIEILDQDQRPVPQRASEWRKSAQHIDREGEQSYLNALNDIYSVGLTDHDLQTDDVLISKSQDTLGLLPPKSVLNCRLYSAAAPALSVYNFSFVSSRYESIFDMASCFQKAPQVMDGLADLPAALWNKAVLTPLDLDLLPVLKRALPSAPQILIPAAESRVACVFEFDESMPHERLEISLWTGFSEAFMQDLQNRDGGTRTYKKPFEGPVLVPLSAFHPSPQESSPTTALGNIALQSLTSLTNLLQTSGLNNLDPSVFDANKQIATKTIWTQDGTRAFLSFTEGADRLPHEFYVVLRLISTPLTAQREYSFEIAYFKIRQGD